MSRMVRRLLLVLAALVSGLSVSAQYRNGGYSELNDSETVRSFKEHLRYLSAAALEGRAAGSEGEKLAAEYMYSVLEGCGLDMLGSKSGDVFGVARQGTDTLVSRNVMGVVQGYDPKLRDRYIVVGARLDNLAPNHMTVDGKPVEQIYYGANGNASGLALMAELARMVSTGSLLFRRSVVFVGFGASREGYAGSWYFLNRSFKEEAGNIDAMINLDMLGAGEGFYAYTCSNPDLNSLLGSLTSQLLPIYPDVTTVESYPSDHRAFYAARIPSVYFTSGTYPEHDTVRDTQSIIDYEVMERELEYIYTFTKTLANTDRMPEFRTGGYGDRQTDDKAFSYNDCDTKPTFMGRNDPRHFIREWVYHYLKYPSEAVENGVQGRVYVEFTIEKNGDVSNVRVTRGVDELLDNEAVRVVKASPRWKPGKVGGKPVRAYLTIPVDFILEKKSNKKSTGIKKY